MSGSFPGNDLSRLWRSADAFRECIIGFQEEVVQRHGVNFVLDRDDTLIASFRDWRALAENPGDEIVVLFHQFMENARQYGPELAGRAARVFSTRINLKLLAECLLKRRVVQTIEPPAQRGDKLADLQGIENEFFILLFCCSFFWLYVAQFLTSNLERERAFRFLTENDYPRVVEICRSIVRGETKIGDAIDHLLQP